MKLNKIVVTVVAAVLVAAAFSGCAPNEGSDAAVLYYQLAGAAATLDPGRTTWLQEETVMLALHEGLTRLDADGRPQPGLAADWIVSSDGLTYTFRLRRGLVFSNGEPLTAEDFVWTWKRNLAPGRVVPRQHLLYPIKGAEAYSTGEGTAADVGVRAVDEQTLVVTLEAPLPYFPALTSLPIYMPLSERMVASSDLWWQSADTYAGTGPFRLQSYSAGDKVVVVRNERYWDADLVKLDRVEFLMGTETGHVWQQFQSGGLHISDIVPTGALDELQERGHLVETPWWGTYYYEIVAAPGEPVAAELTQALSLALDREAIVRVAGGGVAARAFIGPGFPAATTGDFRSQGETYLPLRPDKLKAQAALADAGFADGSEFPGLIIEPGSDDPYHGAIAEALADMWHETLGIDVWVGAAADEGTTAARDPADASPPVLLRRRVWTPDFPDPSDALEQFVTGGSNGLAWNGRAYDDAVALARAEPNAAARERYLHEAERLLLEEGPLIPLFHFTGRSMQQHVQGALRLPTAVTDLKAAMIEQPS